MQAATPEDPLNGVTAGTYNGNTAGEFAGYTTSIIANRSIAWLKTVAKGPDPFFLAVAPKAPHVAATPAPWYLQGTFIDALSAPRDPAYNASKEILSQHHWLIAQQDIITQEQGVEIDNLFRDRWRCLLSVDDAVAGVMQALEDLGVLDNTYLFFTSDHGYNLGQHRLPSCKLNVCVRAACVLLFVLPTRCAYELLCASCVAHSFCLLSLLAFFAHAAPLLTRTLCAALLSPLALFTFAQIHFTRHRSSAETTTTYD
jgi:hypothetical protein